MARVAMVLALRMNETDSPPVSAGIPLDALTTAAIEAWARRLYRDAETRIVLDGPWIDQEDLPQWLVDGTCLAKHEGQ